MEYRDLVVFSIVNWLMFRELIKCEIVKVHDVIPEVGCAPRDCRSNFYPFSVFKTE